MQMVSERPRIGTVEIFAVLFVEEMPGERLFEEAVADSPVSSFSFLAVSNLICFVFSFSGLEMMIVMTTTMIMLLLPTPTPFLSLFLIRGKHSTTEQHPNSILKKPRPVFLPRAKHPKELLLVGFV